LFLAGLFHGVLILGITFSGDDKPAVELPTSLEVVIVTRDYQDRPPPDDARLLAQQNLVGSGNTSRDEPLKTALQQARPAPPGPNQAGQPETSPQTAEREGTRAVVTARLDSPDHLAARQPGDRDQSVQAQQRALPGSPTPVEIVGEPDSQTVLKDNRDRELLVSANTRESHIATYLNDWKRKVERIGTLNFPAVARGRGPAGYPTLEVAIGADGNIRQVVVRRSSGRPVLDQAAMQILKLAAPFKPFPESLRRDYDVIRFAYEWHFTAGSLNGRVLTADGS